MNLPPSDQLVSWLIADLPDRWTIIVLIMTTIAAIFSGFSYFGLRQSGRSQKPYVALDIRSLPDHPEWFSAKLTVVNNLPYVIVTESIRILKPAKGIGLRNDGESDGSTPHEDPLGNEANSSGSAPFSTTKLVTLDFEIARAGHRAVPIRGTSATTSGEKQSRVVFIHNSLPSSRHMLKFEVVIGIKDYDRRVLKVIVPAKLPT